MMSPEFEHHKKLELESFAEFANVAKLSLLKNNVYGFYSREETPVIKDDVFNSLPVSLRRITDAFEHKREKDIILLSCLATAGSLFSNVYGIYDNRVLYPNIYFCVVANAASGKGVLNFIRILVKACSGNLPPTFIIPGNISAAAFINQLRINNGRGLMFEPEGDTISSTLKQDWGTYSDLLRKAFHHEHFSKSRIDKLKQGEVVIDEVECPKLTFICSATPNSFNKLIVGSENGLASRLLLYSFYEISEFRDVRPNENTTNVEELFTGFGKELSTIVARYGDASIKFELTEMQWNEFVTMFKTLKAKIQLIDGNFFQDHITRAGVIFFRLAMIVTILRNPYPKEILVCSNEDFEIVRSMITTLLYHCYSASMSLPENWNGMLGNNYKKSGTQYLYELLEEGKGYQLQELETIGKERLNISKRTVSTYRDSLVNAGLLEKRFETKKWYKLNPQKVDSGLSD